MEARAQTPFGRKQEQAGKALFALPESLCPCHTLLVAAVWRQLLGVLQMVVFVRMMQSMQNLVLANSGWQDTTDSLIAVPFMASCIRRIAQTSPFL